MTEPKILTLKMVGDLNKIGAVWCTDAQFADLCATVEELAAALRAIRQRAIDQGGLSSDLALTYIADTADCYLAQLDRKERA